MEQGSGHWYTLEGEARHWQEGGKRTTLRHARKQNLFPSVSGILGVVNNEFLGNWRIENHLRLAYHNPRRQREWETDYIKRIKRLARQDRDSILEFGTQVHANIEKILLHILEQRKGYVGRLRTPTPKLFEQLDIDIQVARQMEFFLEWLRANVKRVLAVEKIIVHPDGYAGCLDLYCILKNGHEAVVDWKTQNIRESANFYDTWAQQMVAYRAALENPERIRCLSVVIDSNEPAPFDHREWEVADLLRAHDIFRASLAIWQNKKKYKPSI